MAGRNSGGCNAKLLVLNHISPKCEDDLPGIVREAYEASEKKSSVVASFDFMEVQVPRMGFGSHHEDGNIDDDGESDISNLNEEDRPDKPVLKEWIRKVLD